MLCDNLEACKEGGGRETQEEGDIYMYLCVHMFIYVYICVLMADSPHCMAETNTTL